MCTRMSCFTKYGLAGAWRGRGTTRADDAHGTPTQSHISPSILVYEEKTALHLAVEHERLDAACVLIQHSAPETLDLQVMSLTACERRGNSLKCVKDF